MAGTVNDPIIGEAGAFTSVDGSSHVIENVDGALTIDGIGISHINALQVNNGHVHRIAWRMGANVYDFLSVLETVFTSDEHTYLTMLIIRAKLADKLNPYREYTLCAPSDAAFDALESVDPGTLESMYGDDLDRFLQYHVVAGTYYSADLVNMIANYPEGQSGTLPSLVENELLTLTFTEGGQGMNVNDVAIIGSDLLPVFADVETTTGIVHSIGAVLTPPAVAVTDPEAGAVLAAMQADPDGFNKVLASLGSNAEKLDETNWVEDPWTIFAPTDAALGDAEVSLSDIIFVGDLQTPELLLADTDALISAIPGQLPS